MPECPNYLYTKKRYDESRAAMKKIAEFNGVDFDQNFLFDTEFTPTPV